LYKIKGLFKIEKAFFVDIKVWRVIIKTVFYQYFGERNEREI